MGVVQLGTAEIERVAIVLGVSNRASLSFSYAITG
ncbi:unannotated protein [freshwater metagenome]|uniref:Unannotated protein n=1 Tax=freshwater metagenome TaxID=449393 RepID=A0A6J7G1F5_9ZZZZ